MQSCLKSGGVEVLNLLSVSGQASLGMVAPKQIHLEKYNLKNQALLLCVTNLASI